MVLARATRSETVVGLAVVLTMTTAAAVALRRDVVVVRPSELQAHGAAPPGRVVAVEHVDDRDDNAPDADDIVSVRTEGARARVRLGRAPNKGFECCWPVTDLDVSPDGSTVWVSTVDGRLHSIDVAVRRMQDRGRGRAPAVSPDGRLLAFVRAPQPHSRDPGLAELVVRNLESGTESVVGSRAGAPSWSPDGREVLFHHGETLVSVTVDGAGTLGPPRDRCDIPREAGAELPDWVGPVTWARGQAAIVLDDDVVYAAGAESRVRVAVLELDLTTCRTTELTRLGRPEAVSHVDLDATREHLLIGTGSGAVLRWHRGMAAPVEILRAERPLTDPFAW